MIDEELCNKLQDSELCSGYEGIDTNTHTIYVKRDGDRSPAEVLDDILEGTDYRRKRNDELVPAMRSSKKSADMKLFIIHEARKLDEVLDMVRNKFS